MSAPEKASIEIEGGERIPCLFNPSQLSISRSNRWTGDSMPGRGVPKLRYSGARPGTLSVDLFFDTTHSGASVTDHTNKILAIMEIDTSLPGSNEATNNARPPYVTFHWGDLHSFKAVISDLTLTYTYFSTTGVPLRASLALLLHQYEPANSYGAQNPTSGTPNPHQVHRVQAGETLDRIAARYYGDATRWRTLAGANTIADPLALRPGSLLSIPRLEDLT
ncbi:CIS tube protein [Sanguibacter suarezii]|uniref:CIS tube protein n=1 Tax=Sanguibacter suarezii TaxID=60921 RepID=UPI00082FC908|nr:LysM peptidoglycan-binding domain-containing protein [Sanguibacter suarezii]